MVAERASARHSHFGGQEQIFGACSVGRLLEDFQSHTGARCGGSCWPLETCSGRRHDAAARLPEEARAAEEARRRAIEERAKQLQVAAEQKAARDARYAARKARKSSR